MTDTRQLDRRVIDQIRGGNESAWSSLIQRFEGRLLAYVDARLRNPAASEDIVQETLIGFLISLPNYDCSLPLESYLFSICAHKLTDHLRREGRRPTIPLESGDASREPMPVLDRQRGPSAVIRSHERRNLEEEAMIQGLAEQIERCRSRKDWTKLMCLELLFVRGWPNKRIAERLGLSQQQVANYKSDFIIQLRNTLKKQSLSEDVFPELHES